MINPELPFSAHPKIHRETGVLHNFGTLAGLKQRLLVYEVSPEGQAEIAQVIKLDRLSFTHDFVLTRTGYKVFFLVPVAFDVFRAFSGLDSPVDSIEVDRNRSTRILVLHPDGKQQQIAVPFCFLFHYVNGYQLDENHLVVDALSLPDFPSGEQTRRLLNGEPFDGLKGKLWRYTINLKKERVESRKIIAHGLELPNIHPDREGLDYRYMWGISSPDEPDRPLLDGLAKVDMGTGETTFLELFGQLPGEPVFVPRPGASEEDDGWLLYVLFDAHTVSTDLVIADAATLETIATARMPHNVPLGFHGFWMENGKHAS
jgi:all-trans-8'-apo-beta-carotenal 15,15'-oxygenase